MSRYGKVVTEQPEAVLERARRFFGAGGLGLEPTDTGPDQVTFAGGGGHVAVTASRRDDQTELELETQEWDIQVREFLAKL